MDYSSIASYISEMEKLLDSDPSISPFLRMSMKNNLQLMLLFFNQSQDTIVPLKSRTVPYLLGKNQRRINTILQMLILMNLEKQKLLKRLNLQLLRAQLNTIILIIMVSLLPKNKQMLLKGKKFTRMTMPLLLKVSFKPVKNKN